MRWMVDEAYPDVPVIRLVLDNLNTHRMASLYETFPAAEARRIAKRLEFHHTPKHGSWLNMAEIEFSVLARACLRGRNGRGHGKRRQRLRVRAERGRDQFHRPRRQRPLSQSILIWPSTSPFPHQGRAPGQGDRFVAWKSISTTLETSSADYLFRGGPLCLCSSTTQSCPPTTR